MPRTVLLLHLILVFAKTSAQQPVLEWAAGFSSGDIDVGRSVDVDAQGNVYSVGLFHSTIDFDPGPAVYNMTAGGQFGQAIYISKLNTNGGFEWAMQIATHVEGPMDVATDKEGNVYVTSEIREACDVDPGPGVYNIAPNPGFRDAFVLKLDPNGNLIWVKRFRGLVPDTGPYGNAIDIDNNGNVIICGGYNNEVDFDPGPAEFRMQATSKAYDAYIVKLTSNGDFVWVKTFRSNGNYYGQAAIDDVKCDAAGNIVTVGQYSNHIDFDPGPAIFDLSATGSSGTFTCKIDAKGNFIWANQLTYTDYNYFAHSFGVDVDEQQNIFVAGYFAANLDLDPGPREYIISSSGGADGYLIKLNPQGQFVWGRKIGGPSEDACLDVATDLSGSVYITGFFAGNFDFDPGPSVTMTNFYDDAAVAKFDNSGNFVYVAPFHGGLGGGRGLVTDAQRNIYVCGYFAGSIDFDPGPGVYHVPSGSSLDGFVAKLSKCPFETQSSIDITSCRSFTINQITYDSSGTYIQTISNSSGCDSVITINLTVDRKYLSRTVELCEGQSVFAGGELRYISGDYLDTLTSSSGCDSIVSTHLTVYSKPAPDLGKDSILCAGKSLEISPGDFAAYSWHDGSTQPALRMSEPGKYYVEVMDDHGCRASDTIAITAVIPAPAVFLQDTATVCSNGELFLHSTGDFRTFLWSDGSKAPTATVTSAGEYWLEATDENGCIVRDTIVVTAKDCIKGVFVPTAFTPNGDGKNDLFMVAAQATLESFRLQVFDRWGHLVFQTTDPKKGWNGNVNGLKPGSTSFVWLCQYKLKNEPVRLEKGTVMMVR